MSKKVSYRKYTKSFGKEDDKRQLDETLDILKNQVDNLTSSVNTITSRGDADTYKGTPGDIKINKIAQNRYEFYIRGEDGWHKDNNASFGPIDEDKDLSDPPTVNMTSGQFNYGYEGNTRLTLNLDPTKISTSAVATPTVKGFGNLKFESTGNTILQSALQMKTVPNASTDPDKFLVLDASDNVKYRTGAQILSDLGIAADEIIDWTADQGSTNIHANNIVITHNEVTDFDSEVNALAQVKIDALVDSAPGALDTLNELAAALNDDANFATTVTNTLATKLNLSGGTLTGDLTINAPSSKLILSGDDTSENHEIESDGNLYLSIDKDADDTNNFFQFRAHSGGTLKNIMRLQDDGQVGIGVTDPDSRLEVVGAGNDNSTHAFYVKNSSNTGLFYVRDDGVVSILGGYLFAQHSSGAYFTGSIKARGGVTDDQGDLGLGSGGNVDHMTISGGNVAIGTATGSPNMKLEVVAGENDGILINRNATTTDSPVEVGFRHTTSAGDAATGMRSYRTNEDDSYDQELRFFTTAGSGGQAEHLTIKHNGKIGMGTSTPDANLQIHSTSGTKLWLTANGGNPADAASLRFAESENGNNYVQLSYDGSANTLSVDSNNNNDMTVWDRVNNRMTNNAYVWNYRTSFPQVKYSQNGSDFVEKGLSGNIFYNKTSSANVDFKWRDNTNAELLTIDTGGKTLTIAEGAQTTYRLKIGNNGRMNMPMQGPEFEADHGYFAPLGTMFLPLFINATQTDLLRFQTPQIIQYWDYTSSAWVDDSSNISNFKNLLDGRRATSYALTNTKRKFRFVIERASTWAEDQLYYIENTWSSIGTWSTSAAGGGSLTPTMQVERLDGSFDASDDSNNDWTTNSGFTTDWHTTGIWNNFGLAMFYVTDQHNAEKHIRITVTFPEYADTSKTIALKNIGAMSSYSSVNTNQQPFWQSFDRHATSAANINVTGNLSIGDTSNSGSEFHIKKDSANARARIQTANTNGVAYLRLENDAQNWDVRVDGGNSDKFIIRDETGSTNRFLMDTSGNIVTTGNMSPSGYLQLTGPPSDPGVDGTVRLGEETNVLKIFSNYGWIRLGAESASWAHIRTDRSQFYFDKKIVVDEGIVSSYDEDLILRRDYNDTTYNQITIGDDTLDIKLDNTSRLAIDGNGQVDLTGDLVLRGEKGIFIENLGGPTGTSTSYGGSIIQPATAMYRTANNTHTGFIKIVVPTSTGAHPRDMLTFWVDVFDYASGDSFSAYISGYNYQDVGSNEWHNCDAMILGTESHRDFTVRFCHDNTNPCITIGETDTTWNYLQVTVRNVQVGFTADIDDFKGDWAITVETTLPSVVDETVSGNFPIAKRTIGTADIATQVTLTDQGGDSTCFPVFSTANTGDRDLHTDISNLTYNSTNGTLTSTSVSATNLEVTNKLNITTTTDAVATFKMTDDAWGYMEWRKNNNDRVAYFGMDSDMNRMLIAANENGTNELEINTTTVDINASVDISGTLDMEENNITNVGDISVDKVKADAASDVSISLGTGGIIFGAEANDTYTFNLGEVDADLVYYDDEESELFKIDAGNKRVGIGLASPTTTLDVEGTVSYKHVAVTASSDAVDVSGATVVECTPSGNISIGGFSGGVQGQVIHVLKVDSGFGRVFLEHNESTGTQKIFLSGGSDVAITQRGGVTLYCTGSEWIALDK